MKNELHRFLQNNFWSTLNWGKLSKRLKKSKQLRSSFSVSNAFYVFKMTYKNFISKKKKKRNTKFNYTFKLLEEVWHYLVVPIFGTRYLTILEKFNWLLNFLKTFIESLIKHDPFELFFLRPKNLLLEIFFLYVLIFQQNLGFS